MTIDPPRIISRAGARALGLKRYFTGKPCKHGHVAERWVGNSECMECNRASALEWRVANPEKARGQERERGRKHRAANPQKDRERQRKWRATNPEKARERDRLHYAKNKDKILSQIAARRAADPQKHRDYMRMWRAANPEKVQEYRRMRRATNKDKISKRRAARRKAARDSD
jgi:hypothetical protein